MKSNKIVIFIRDIFFSVYVIHEVFLFTLFLEGVVISVPE